MSTKDQLFRNIMQTKPNIINKITVIGVGSVGMAVTFSILAQNISSDVAMVDLSEDKLKGELMDLQHGCAFLKNANITASTNLSITAGSRMVIITAGARQKEGESRLDLVQRNTDILKNMVPKLVQYSPDCNILIVSNPCDILAYVAWKLSGLPKNRVFGLGTNLDSSRFRFLLAKRLGVAATSVHGCIIGEHGETSVPVWSSVNIAGVRLKELNSAVGTSDDDENWKDCHKDVINAANEIIKLKGYTSWSIGLSCADVVSAIFRNSHEIKPISTLVKGMYGIDKEVFLSLPCVLNANGVATIINLSLTDVELKVLHSAAHLLDEIQKGINF
ncbi:unnamed protein product [Diamesa serratosioi]